MYISSNVLSDVSASQTYMYRLHIPEAACRVKESTGLSVNVPVLSNLKKGAINY